MIKKILLPAIFCDRCDEDVEAYNGHPYVMNHEKHYCPECALITGIIDAMDYVDLALYGCGHFDKAEYKNGKLIAYQKCGRGYSKSIFEVEDKCGNTTTENI